MAFKPTNVFRSLAESARCEFGTMDPERLRLRLGIADCWFRPLLLEDFADDDVSVKVDEEKRQFCVDALATSRRQPDDFTRLRRRVQLPEEVDVSTVRCWMEDGVLVVLADYLPQAYKRQQAGKQQRQFSGLVDSGSCLVKDKAAGGARWQVELPMPEFSSDELRVTRDGARVVIEAEHAASSKFAECRHVVRRELPPPAGVSLDQLEWRFRDGLLRLEAPAPGLKVRKTSKIATLTRELRHSPTFQEKEHCIVS